MKDSPYRHLGNRRDFLRTAACAALTTAGITNTIRDLRLINAAVAQQPLTGYKALVCVFLNGGNDANNLVVPKEATAYANYASIRGNLALPQSSLLSLNAINDDGREFAVHPACTDLQTLFTQQKLAFLFNTGTLAYPMTRTQYSNKSVPKPPQLFSHSDQVTQWQTSIPDQPPKSGWGGRCADLLHSLQPGAQISLCTSINGQNTFEVGNTVQQYHVSTSGAVTLKGLTTTNLSTNQLNTVKALLELEDLNLQQEAYSQVVSNSVASGALLTAAIATEPTWPVAFRTTGSLGPQLRMVARLINARNSLNMKRQIFYVSAGGYDTHTGQVGIPANPADTTVGNHANLLDEVNDAIWAFSNAMDFIGQGSNVTSFTASDFGRTFPTNGVGSDHGWGSHHIVAGGAVQGKRTYGNFPIHTLNGPDDTNLGRWIPTTAVDQYAATLATWFGVDDGDLSYVFPNLGRFASPNLGFML